MSTVSTTDKKILRISIALLIVSLAFKCYCTTTSCAYSFLAFLLGWLNLLSGLACFAWLANPLLIFSWIMLGRNLKLSMFLSVFSTLIAMSFMLVDSIVDNEGGIRHPIVSLNAGYWLWLCSHVTMLAGTFWMMLQSNNAKQRESKNKNP